MKIDGPASLRSSSTQRARRADGGNGADFARHMSAGTGAGASGVGGSTQLGSVGALLALQEMPPPSEDGARPEVDRAEDLLDRLDQLRVGLLTGRLSRGTLEGIVERLDARRREGVDPRLAGVIDEIELRARVELAKLSMA